MAGYMAAPHPRCTPNHRVPAKRPRRWHPNDDPCTPQLVPSLKPAVLTSLDLEFKTLVAAGLGRVSGCGCAE
jgi:hypothetical protein